MTAKRTRPVTLVVSPITDLRTAALGAHLMQAIAREEDFDASVRYANLDLGKRLGAENFFAFGPYSKSYCGEVLFGEHAYACWTSPPDQELDEFRNHIGFHEEMMGRPVSPELERCLRLRFTPFGEGAESRFGAVRAEIDGWLDDLVRDLLLGDPVAVGCTTMFFDQLAANLAILRRVKHLRPDVLTILGGAHCTGVMADAAFDATDVVDYVFAGEAEVTFRTFLRDLKRGNRPCRSVIHGAAPEDLDTLPIPDFTDYITQMAAFRDGATTTTRDMTFSQGIPMEASRGCPWMDASGCHFCSLNPELRTRTKSGRRVVEEIRSAQAQHPGSRISFFDLMLSRKTIHEVMPKIKSELSAVTMSAEVRPDLSYREFRLMKEAGLARIQIGVESLSTDVLQLMNKGVKLRQTLRSMRWCRALDIDLAYNIIWGNPGERAASYEQMLDLMPQIVHFSPPGNIVHLQFQRHSHYVMEPAKFGVSNVKPTQALSPRISDTILAANLAFYFSGAYECEIHERQDLVVRLYEMADMWSAAWRTERRVAPSYTRAINPPVLKVLKTLDDRFRVIDTRELAGTEATYLLPETLGRATLREAKCDGTCRTTVELLERKLVIIDDGWRIPLATADHELMDQVELTSRASRATDPRAAVMESVSV